MALARNKRGDRIELTTIIEILLVVVGAGLIIGIFIVASSSAEEKTSEALCRGINALRFGTKVEKGPASFNFVPRACKTIDKGDLPGKDYKDHKNGLTGGAKAELRDMAAKCWWMWLEGKQPNIFDTSTLSFKNNCFVCYTFSLQKDLNIPIQEFAVALNEPKYAVDKSDGCAPRGQGGHCKPSCDKSSGLKEVPSNLCVKDSIKSKCCIDEDLKNGCKNKGGKCSNGPEGEFTEFYNNDEWQCKSGKCYVKKENLATYYDYIQGTRGVGGGAGFIAYQTGLDEFKSGKQYGVTLISPGKSPSWDTLGLGTATALAGVGTLAATYYSPFFKKELFVAGAGGTYYLYSLTEKSGVPAGYNYIYLAEYDSIKDKCSVEAGVGQT